NHPEAVPYEDGWAVPLAGTRPDWYTPAVEEQVLAAGGTPVAAPTDAPLPSEIGIRPGSWMSSPCGCTVNFVFTKHGPLAIGTGGTPRAGIALTWKTDSYGWDSPAIFGDSGSPVRVTNLQAAGDLTHLVVDTHWLPSIIAGTRIGKMLQIAKGWALVNSPLCP